MATTLTPTQRQAPGAGRTSLPSMAVPRLSRMLRLRTQGWEPNPIPSNPRTISPTAASARRSWPIVMNDEAVPAFLPHAIDFAFLADLGLTIAEETDRPETYGLAGWTDYAGFTLSLSRELEIALADPQPHYDGAVGRWQKLDVVDLLQVGVDVFGHRATAAHGANLSGTARYAGGLIGTALDRSGLPPVTGDAGLALDLGTLDGTASFTSLLVYPDGIPETFAGGTLYYPFGLSDGVIVGTGAGLTLRADFYGPGHEEVAGLIHDPRAGLLGSYS